MGLKFFDLIRPKNGRTSMEEVLVKEFFDAAEEYQIRNLAWMMCVDLIANALGRCTFRTYKNHKEIWEDENYLWNVEPNTNQNSTQFLHKMVAQLLANGEVLIIDSKNRQGKEMLVVADSFTASKLYPAKQREYTDVTVGDLEYSKTFRESDVLHLELTHKDAKEVIAQLNRSYQRMYTAAVNAYTWSQGQHWKVHVSQMASGEDGWEAKFKKMMDAQVRPFLKSDGAVLPEFDGYKFENAQEKTTAKIDTRDIRALTEDIFDFTARGLLIPPVLVKGSVENTADANKRWLTICIDPLADQLQQEIIRKRYGADEWKKGTYLMIDTSTIMHFDLFDAAAGIEKLIGSGAYTVNDILRALNQPTIDEPWADKHFMTLNFTPVDQAAVMKERGGGQ